ncbi:MAG: T9SS type A sorting domain-containing protein [Bacteroidales bacterium]|nr:T9SS type A sorting domain-containing protein [Bacteroidales bacterium]
MKKITLLLALGFVASVSFAQLLPKINKNLPLAKEKCTNADVTFYTPDEYAQAKSGGDVFFTEDFGGGVPTGWTIIDETGNDWLWIWSTAEPTSPWDGGSGPINSTTGGNGFMIYNAATFSGGTMPAHDAHFTTTAIDCSTAASVVLKFEQRFRWCCTGAAFLVQVSTDDFANFNEYDVTYDQAGNAVTADPMFVEINISDVAANNANVKIRFRWTTASHYYWMIDDIELKTAYDHELRVEDVKIHWGYLNGGYFGQIPMEQLMAANFDAVVFNNGINDETNTTFAVDINEAWWEGSTVYGTLNTLTRDTITVNDFVPDVDNPMDYVAAYYVYSDFVDDNPDNNYDTIRFSTTANTYARDYERTRETWPGAYQDGADGDMMGCNYYLPNDDTVYSLSVYVSNRSNPGTTLIAKIYDEDGNEILASEEYDIPSAIADNGGWVTLDFVDLTGEDLFLAGGDGSTLPTYTAGVQIYFGGDTLMIGADGNSFHYFNIASAMYAGGTWYFITLIPQTRLNFSEDVYIGTENVNNILSSSIYPNPVNDFATLSFNLKETSNVNIEVYDMAGKLVMNKNLGSRLFGNNNVVMDVTDMESGIYFYTVNANGYKTTNKMVIAR